MRQLKAIVLCGFGLAFIAASSPEAVAADLGVTRVKNTSVRVGHRVRVVRDYDGTAVVERRIRSVERVAGGTVVTHRYEMIPSERATPARYFNGQPVLPHGQRRPLRLVVTAHR